MRRGFTLIELLAVITILSIIVLVASISVADMLKESKKELSAAQIRSIKESAKSWSSDNMDILPIANNCSFIMLKDLKDTGLLDSKVINPKDNKNIPNETKIKITSKIGNNGKSILDYEVDSDDISECTYIGSNMYVDIPKGLTPVLYDKKLNSWRVPNINEEWYDYDKQEWANAVVLGKGKSKKPGEVVTVEGENPEALMMLVYIPRYEYKIEGDFGKGGQSAALPGEIEINFVLKTEKGYNAASGYRVHPAFTFGDKEVSGFWVGKFELSSVGENLSVDNNLGCNATSCTSDISKLRILPNKVSLRYNNVSNFWYGIKSIENTSSFGLSNIDSHMIKNSEWGAVAYLSQSKYGKYGNNDYDKQYREVYQNKSSSYITGSSNGTPSQNTTNTQCAYNDMQDLGEDTNGYKKGQCGPGASTTGNIYGVYDMSGGAYEYVMGAYGSESPTIGNSGFASNVFTGNTIESKYYDIYANATNSDTNDGSQSCNNGICYGHAISETARWYGDFTHMIYSNYSWFVRGGSYLDGISTGVFFHSYTSGNSKKDNSARVVGFGK